MSIPTPAVSGNVRIWTVEDGVHPARAPKYQSIAVLSDPSWSFGDRQRVEVPDPGGYNKFVEAATVPGTVDRPTYGIQGRYPLALSELLRLARKQCRLDVFALVGDCKDPQNFSEGWEKILFFPAGEITNWSGEGLGTLSSDDNNPANESADLSSREIYEFGALTYGRLGSADTVREVYTTDICDDESCGDCGDASDGCQRLLATMAGVGATPGTLPSVLYSADGGSTFSSEDISSLFSNEAISDGECIGGKLVLVANGPNSIHYRDVDELFLGTGSWTEVNTGFVAGGEPNAIFSVDARHTWIVGDGGYIYFAENPTVSVAVQDAGVATTQNLNAVGAVNSEVVVAVGASNAVVYSINGGDTWGAVTGPAVGVALNAVWVWSEDVWLVGTAGGALWYTVNQGQTWTQKTIPGTLTSIDKIVFTDEAEGFMTVQDATGGLIYKTITGGYEWSVLPDGAHAAVPGNDYFNDLAICGIGKNRVFAGGLDDDSSTGIIVTAEA